MNSQFNKTVVTSIAVLFSILIPILILVLFYLIFSDFYSKGFLTGLGHILVCGLMIILNLFVGTYFVLKIFSNRINKELNDSYVSRRIFIIIISSIALQVVLNILIENPFKDPPMPNFL